MIGVIIDNLIILMAGISSMAFSNHVNICLAASGLLMLLVSYEYVSQDEDGQGEQGIRYKEISSQSISPNYKKIRFNLASFLTSCKVLLILLISALSGNILGLLCLVCLDRIRKRLQVFLFILFFTIYDYMQLLASAAIKDASTSSTAINSASINSVSINSISINSASLKAASIWDQIWNPEAFSSIFTSQHLAWSIVRLLFLGLCLQGLFLVKYYGKRKRMNRLETQHKLTMAAVREWHEKKLNQELTKQAYLNEQQARMLERENISRNIHNAVGHSITAAVMTLDAADMLFEKKPEESHKRMLDAKARIQGSLEAIRSAVRVLDQVDAKVSFTDLRKFLDDIVENFVMDTELKVEKFYDFYSDMAELDKSHVEFLTGVLEEALTNGLKHGHATAYMLTVTADSGHVKMMVKDNGHGIFNEENSKQLIDKGFGLKKIQSYVKRVGGKCTFAEEDGFRTEIMLPLEQTREEN